MKKSVVLSVLSFAFPVLASAQTTNVTNLQGVFQLASNIINTLLPLIIAAGVVYFVYGIARYVIAGDEEAKAAAKDKIIYGVIGLFVMVSVWGLVNILRGTLFSGGTTAPTGGTTGLPEVRVTI